VNLPKIRKIGTALPIQDINYDSANILALTCPFRLCEFSHLEKAKRMKGVKFVETSPIYYSAEQAEKEICFLYKSCMFKLEIAIDRRSPRKIPNQCHLSDPPHFSLPSIFKKRKKPP
jgi:hypothetical protein